MKKATRCWKIRKMLQFDSFHSRGHLDGDPSGGEAVVLGSAWDHDLLGLGGKRVQVLQWMISLITGISCERGAGTIPRLGIMGFMGVIPAIMPRLGSKSGGRKEIWLRSQAATVWERSKTNTVIFNHRCFFQQLTLWPVISSAHTVSFKFHFTLCTYSLSDSFVNTSDTQAAYI